VTFDRTSIWLHWLTALLVAALWTIGQTAEWFARGSTGRFAMWSSHFTLGALLALIYIVRVIWKLSRGRRLPGVGSPWLVKLAAAGHGLLYVGLAVVISLGISAAVSRGSSVWGLFHYPKLIDDEWREPLSDWHGLAANILLGVAGAHALIALVHQYVWRDGVLTRMWPALGR
jgi:cytochrome b561